MKRWKLALGIFAIFSMALAIFFVLQDEKALVIHPKGIIAKKELDLIALNYSLMLILVIPTIAALFFIAWKYRSKNTEAKYMPEHSGSAWAEISLWAIPSAVIAVMAVILWDATHDLDPYKPLDSDLKPLTIQVVALDWKWLFIYPEQEIASLNYFQIPEKTPIHFELAADGSPMNSFWIPELSGQIYAMAGMKTEIHMMADGPGEYRGRASEINGAGFADMTFQVKSTSLEDFDAWVEGVKGSSLQLTDEVYEELLRPSHKNPITFYSSVEPDLFHKIMMKYMVH